MKVSTRCLFALVVKTIQVVRTINEKNMVKSMVKSMNGLIPLALGSECVDPADEPRADAQAC